MVLPLSGNLQPGCVTNSVVVRFSSDQTLKAEVAPKLSILERGAATGSEILAKGNDVLCYPRGQERSGLEKSLAGALTAPPLGSSSAEAMGQQAAAAATKNSLEALEKWYRS